MPEQRKRLHCVAEITLSTTFLLASEVPSVAALARSGLPQKRNFKIYASRFCVADLDRDLVLFNTVIALKPKPPAGKEPMLYSTIFRSTAITAAGLIATTLVAISTAFAQTPVFQNGIQVANPVPTVVPQQIVVTNPVKSATAKIVPPAKATATTKKTATAKAVVSAKAIKRAAEPADVVKVYPVGNLVSTTAIRSMPFGKTTLERWQSEYPETIEALDELGSIVQSMCSSEPAAIKAYVPSLSLIVRHTQKGHDEIESLLRSLGQQQEPSIEMTYRLLYVESPPKLGKEHDESDLARMQNLLSKKVLSADETAELQKFIPKQNGMEYATRSITMRPGVRTPWSVFHQPYTTLGRHDQKSKTTQLRVDFFVDEASGDQIEFGSEVLTLSHGESGLMHAYVDGSSMTWLISAKPISDDAAESPTQSESVPQIATKPK